MARRSQRIVLKFGSGILSTKRGIGLSRPQIARLAREVGALIRAGHQCVIVSSGAVAAGPATPGPPAPPKELPRRPARAPPRPAHPTHPPSPPFPPPTL